MEKYVKSKDFTRKKKIKTTKDTTYKNVVNYCKTILSNSAKLIYKKWNSPAVSLTGGCDSKTTLACINGFYDKYKYFSYISNESEKVDALAASAIAKIINIEHKIYETSMINEQDEDIEIWRKIIDINSGCIGYTSLSEIKKRMLLYRYKNFDVEVKSWVSEVGRGYYYKRFLKKKFPEIPKPRHLTTMYKFFFHNRKLVKQTDEIFKKYLEKYCKNNIFSKISWVDLFFWEFRLSSWNGLVITGEHRISSEITIPYNNRILIENFLAIPIEKRVSDQLHKDIMREANQKIADLDISVVNLKHTKMRAFLEKIYFEIHTRIPF